MSPEVPRPVADDATPPPRAFTQGVGTVYQFVGVTLFLASMFVCCASGLLSKDTATRRDLTRVGWRMGDATAEPVYSAQRAITISLVLSVFFGMALAGLGLGLQAQARLAAPIATVLTLFATAFWVTQVAFFSMVLGSVVLVGVSAALALLMGAMCALASGAWRDMRRDPPPESLAILPRDYKIPYSHMHPDPP
ncbi:MAG: hypothetical protein ACREJC_04070, partial [Tepidisphaeraceae bacterium]